MAGTAAGVLLIVLACLASGVAVYLMVMTENYGRTLLLCIPIMFLAFVLVTAGSAFLIS